MFLFTKGKKQNFLYYVWVRKSERNVTSLGRLKGIKLKREMFELKFFLKCSCLQKGKRTSSVPCMGRESERNITSQFHLFKTNILS